MPSRVFMDAASSHAILFLFLFAWRTIERTRRFTNAERYDILCGRLRGPKDVRLAFRVPAGVAFDAALFEDQGLAALGAFRVQAFPEELRGVAGLLLELDVRLDRAVRLVVRLDGRLHAGLLHPDVPLDRLRDRVGDRVDAFSVVDRHQRATARFDLGDDFGSRRPG